MQPKLHSHLGESRGRHHIVHSLLANTGTLASYVLVGVVDELPRSVD